MTDSSNLVKFWTFGHLWNCLLGKPFRRNQEKRGVIYGKKRCNSFKNQEKRGVTAEWKIPGILILSIFPSLDNFTVRENYL